MAINIRHKRTRPTQQPRIRGPYRIDNRVERTEVNLHLKHRTQRRSSTSESASSRGRHRANDQNRHLVHKEDDSRAYRASSSGKYEGDERRTPVFSNANECDSGTVLDRGYMPEIPRATPASNEQAVGGGGRKRESLYREDEFVWRFRMEWRQILRHP